MTGGIIVGDVRIPGRVLIAPMTGVSDLPFRQIASRLGAAYVATEMVACESFARGRPDVVRRAAVGEGLPLTVIQLVGRSPADIAQGAAMAERAGADLIDLNMGCPAKEVTGGLSGSALMRDLDLAEAIIRAATEATMRPVTLKMRLGWDAASRNAPELAARAQAAGVKAITVHGRTRQQFYKGVADWRAVARVKAAVSVPVIVNSDVTDLASLRTALAQSGADAAMLGRGVYGRPWIAAALDRTLACGGELGEPDVEARLQIVLDHLRQSLAFYGERIGVRMFKKHLGYYIEAAPWPATALARREAKAQLCRLDEPNEIERSLLTLWRGEHAKAAA